MKHRGHSLVWLASLAGLVSGAMGCDEIKDSNEVVPDSITPRTIRVLVLTTDDEWDELSATRQDPIAFATYRIELGNLVLSNSGVSHRLELAGVEPLGVSEADIFAESCRNERIQGVTCVAEWLNRSLKKGGPAADARDRTQADITMLIVTNDQEGGFDGYARGTPYDEDPHNRACGVNEERDTLGFVHEIGHVLGAGHDRYAREEPNANGINYGVTLPGVETTSLMAYVAECVDLGFECTRVPWFSTPDASFYGQPLGNLATHHNACIVEYYGSMVADYYEMTSGTVPVELYPEITSCPYTMGHAVSVGGSLCQGDYEVRSDAELADLADCGTVRGSLTIEDGVTSLAPLSELVMVQGSLTVRSRHLTSLAGLESLRSVSTLVIASPVTNLHALGGLQHADDLTIQDAAITDLGGLGTLSVLRNLTVAGCPSLTSMSGLDRVTAISGTLRVNDCDALTDFDGLEGIEHADALLIQNNAALTRLTSHTWLTSARSVRFDNNPSLTSLAGLESITRLDVGLTLLRNPSLSDLDGVRGLTHAGSVLLDRLDALTDLHGLDALSTIDGDLSVMNSGGLLSLAGLGALEEVGGMVEIDDLDSILELSGLGSLRTIRSDLRIDDNDHLLTLRDLRALQEVPMVIVRRNERLRACDLPELPGTELTCELVK